MFSIDADTHVDETDDTWEYLDDSERHLAPLTVRRTAADAGLTPPGVDRYGLAEGRLRLRRIGSDERTGAVEATRELLDVEARLRHMDRLGVDVQVVYPTLLVNNISRHLAVEAALCRSYNRWM